MQDTQLLMLPQRLRKKQSQRSSQDPLQTYGASLSARGQSHNVWRPAGCHSVHTTGVEGVHLQHPFSRPSSPCQTRKSCSDEASQSYDKENEVTSMRSSRIFKQSKPQDVHLKGAHPHHQLPSQQAAHINIHQGMLHFPYPSSRASRSPSPRSYERRPALSTISNNYLNMGSNNSILQPPQQQQSHTGVSSFHAQTTQRTPGSRSPSGRDPSCNRRISCGSSSSCSGYTPGARGTPHVEYISPLREGLRVHQQQQRQPQLTPSSQHPASPYLHALAREIEQQQCGQASINSRNVSPLGCPSSQQQPHTPVCAPASHRRTASTSQQQCSPNAERASSPVQLLDDARTEEPEDSYYSPVLPNLHHQFQQQYHLTPCYNDLDEYDTVQQEESGSCSGRQMQGLVSPQCAESRPTHQLSSCNLSQRVAALLKPAATVVPNHLSTQDGSQGTGELAAPAELYEQRSDLAVGLQQQYTGQAGLLPENSLVDASPMAPCDQDPDRPSNFVKLEHQRRGHAAANGHLEEVPDNRAKVDTTPRGTNYRQQSHAGEPSGQLGSQEDLELQCRRQQWRAYQQLQQQQHWLSQLELQQQQPQQQQQQRSKTPVNDGNRNSLWQQQAQEPAAMASPAAAAAASALADYSRIIGEAQAMAQKSEAAWAQLNKYHQQRVCGRLPGGSSTSRSHTPTSVAGNRQLSRMGRPNAAAAGASNTVAAAAGTAVSPTPCKALGSYLLQMNSPAVYHTPTGGFSSSGSSNCSVSKLPLPPAFQHDAARGTAAAGAKYRELPSLPGSPAAAAKQYSSSSGCQAEGGRTPTMPRQLKFGPPVGTAGVMQSLRDSTESLKAAARVSIAANLRSSCEATPSTLLPIPACSGLATQPTGVRGSGQSDSGSDSVLMPRVVSRQGTRSQACSLLPSSPAWSVYLTPGAAEPASTGAAATGSDTIMSRCAGLVGGSYSSSKGAWWRTPEDQESQQSSQQQQPQEAMQYGSAVATPVIGASPVTVVRPRDLLDCFDGAGQHLAPADPHAAASYGAQPAFAAAAGHAAVQGCADSGSSSSCSHQEGFPFMPGSRHTCSGDSSSSKHQHLVHQASHVIPHGIGSTPSAFESQAAAVATATEPAMHAEAIAQMQGSSTDSDLAWLDKYIDAKSAAIVTPDSSLSGAQSAGSTQGMGGRGFSSALDAASMDATCTGGDTVHLGHDRPTHEHKETWTVHNNWVATGMDAVTESIDVTEAAVALCSMTDAVSVPSCSTACPSGSAVDGSASGCTALQPDSMLHHQETSSIGSSSKQVTPSTTSHAITPVTTKSTVGNLENFSPLLDNLTPAQALAAYTQLAHKLKQRMDETAGGLLARLNLSTPVSSCSPSARSSIDSRSKGELQSSAAASAVASTEAEGSMPAAVVCKQDVGMVVLSPHTACGRWQSSRAAAE